MLSAKKAYKFAGSFCVQKAVRTEVMTIVSEGVKESPSDWISVWRSYLTYVCAWGLGNTDPGRVKKDRRSW